MALNSRYLCSPDGTILEPPTG